MSVSLLILFVFLQSFFLMLIAASMNSLQRERSNIKNEMSETEEQLDGIKEELSGTMQDINKVANSSNFFFNFFSLEVRLAAFLSLSLFNTSNEFFLAKLLFIKMVQ